MASKRTFYRTILQVEVLSETPYNETSLTQVADDITEGQQIGKVTIITASEELNSNQTVKALQEAGSEPEFFCLNKHGEDVLEDEEEDDDNEPYQSSSRKMRD